MILDDNTSTLTTGATAGVKKNENVNKAYTLATTKANAMSSKTFVVKLKDSTENGAANSSPRTNLLKLFSENRSPSNVSVVKALGIGRIVINRTLLKNPKNKTSLPFQRKYNTSVISTPSHAAATPISVKIPSDTMKTTPSKAPIFVRSRLQNISNGKENETCNGDKKCDDISGNLANFMHFKLSSIVPPPMKPEPVGGKTFKVDMNSIEVVLPRAVESTQEKETLKTEEEKKRSVSQDSNDDLTSLSWLTDNDKGLLKAIRSCNPDDAGISLSGDETDEEEDVDYNENRAVFTAKSKVECSGQGGFAARQYGQSYDHNGKPPYSFSCLIFMAVEDSIEKKLPVKEIYSWVCKHFPYFQSAPSGWKNSIRHNLSLNKCFKKADQGKNSHDAVKGSLWCIDPAYRPNLIQALKRTPFYPYLYPGGIGQPLSLNNLASLLPGVRSGRIPSWSPNMFSPKSAQFTDPDVASAALNLLGLKGNDTIDKQSPNVKSTLQELAAEIFNQNSDSAGIPLIITDPAEDHTYSTMSFAKTRSSEFDDRCTSPDSDKSAPDAAYEFETCGTDIDSDVDVEMMPNEGEGTSECDLGDSGFASLRGGRKRKNPKLTPERSQKKRRKSTNSRNSEKSATPGKSSSTKAKVSSQKGTLKVRFQSKKKVRQSSTKTIMRKTKSDGAMSSDVDSGKDSPKVKCKSRSRTRTKTRSVETTSKKKDKKPVSVTEPNHNSPYGTRSRSQTRHSKRIAASDHGNVLERASARKRRQDSVSIDLEEEEIKLAAGSLLHLAGFRSPPSSSQTNP